MKSKPNSILDLSKMILPLALLKVTEAFRNMNNGEVMEILTEDQETRDCLFKVLPASCYNLIEINEMESFCRIRLRKN